MRDRHAITISKPRRSLFAEATSCLARAGHEPVPIARNKRSWFFLNKAASAIAMLRAPCRGGCVSGWLEERNLAHKESIRNIPSRFSFEMPPKLLHMSHHFRYSPESRQVQSPAALRICAKALNRCAIARGAGCGAHQYGSTRGEIVSS